MTPPVFISHKLEEVLRIADRVVVLRSVNVGRRQGLRSGRPSAQEPRCV
jgi:ABC-type sugar transport system ATPase subunit